MPLTMKTALNGLATTIPQLTQIYFYSLQHNIDKAQELRLETESDKRIEQIDLDMKQSKEIFPDKQGELQSNIKATDARADASNALKALYKADEITAGWNNKLLEQRYDNDVKSIDLRNSIQFELTNFSKLRNPTPEQVAAHGQKMEHAVNQISILEKDFGFLTDKDRLDSVSAKTMMELSLLFGSGSKEANAAYGKIIDDPNTTIRDALKILQQDPQFQNSSIRAGLDKLAVIRRENAEAFTDFVTDAIKDAGLDGRVETDRTHVVDGEFVYNSLGEEDVKSLRDTKDREIMNLVYTLARRGIPELGVPPMGDTDLAGRIYDPLFYNTWYLWLPPVGAREWDDNNPDVLRQNEVNRIKQRVFEDSRTSGRGKQPRRNILPRDVFGEGIPTIESNLPASGKAGQFSIPNR